MKICLIVGILFFTCFAVTISCKCKKYGNCDPGPKCENPWKIDSYQRQCIDCSDGGYFTWDKNCDGVYDCKKGSDEIYCEEYFTRSKFV